jgi:hypothetical protein
MAGRGQPPPAVRPQPPTPQLSGARRGGRSAAAVPPPLPTNQPSLQHAPPPATILHDMFSTCLTRGIAAKLVYKTVGSKVEVSLYCSTAAVSASKKQGRKRPDNERRRLKREAWIQRRASSRPGSTTAAAAETLSGCEDISSGAGAAAAAAVTTVRSLTQKGAPAACGAATAAPASAATPPRAWAWEQRSGLVVLARRVQDSPMESPETSRNPDGPSELNISISSFVEERETDGVSDFAVCGKEQPLTYAVAAARATTTPVLDSPRRNALVGLDMVERAQPAFRPPPTPPPWSKHFSSHHMRVLCTSCFAGNREIRNAKCSDCYRGRERRVQEAQRSCAEVVNSSQHQPTEGVPHVGRPVSLF